MTNLTLPDPGERNPTLTNDQLKLFLRPECCISFALQAVVRELLEWRTGARDFADESCPDCGGPLHMACKSYDDLGQCFKNVHG